MIAKNELDELISMLDPRCDAKTVEIVKARILNAMARSRAASVKTGRSDQQKVDPYDSSAYK